MSKDMNKSIHCFGASIVDVLMKPITKYPDPKVISNVFVDDMKFAPGGGATNCSLTLAKLDANVRLFSMVGSDHYGDYLKKEIKEAPIALIVIAKTPTLTPPLISPHFKFLSSVLFLTLS